MEQHQHLIPIREDAPDYTMAKKLIINVAPTGAFSMRSDNPNQPYSIKEVTNEVISAYKHGASMWHVHIRNEEGRAYTTEADKIMEALDRVLDECPDIILSHSAHVDPRTTGSESLKPLVEPLMERGAKMGRRYIHTMVTIPYTRHRLFIVEPILVDIVTYLQGYNIKPEFQIHNYVSIRHVDSWLLKPGILQGKPIMNIIMGFHGSDFSAPISPEPWGRLYFISMLNNLPPGSIVGTTCGGHSWLPMCIEGISLGCELVRIGMEEAIWLYPHKDDLIKNNVQVVRKVKTIAKELGREIATPQEVVQLLGLAA